MTCRVDHAAIKADPAKWQTLKLRGVFHIEADETGPAENIENRNCTECDTTLSLSFVERR